MGLSVDDADFPGGRGGLALLAAAILALVVVNALGESPWGVFSIAMTIPIASRTPPMRSEKTRTAGGGRMGGPSTGKRRSGQNICGKSVVA